MKKINELTIYIQNRYNDILNRIKENTKEQKDLNNYILKEIMIKEK